MKKLLTSILWFSIAGSLVACNDSLSERAARDEITMVEKDDPAMSRAFEKARRTFPEFLALAEQPPARYSGFSIKVRISDGKNDEYFWVAPFSHTGSSYTGTLDNDGELITSYHAGQKITFPESDIVDWLYHDEATGAMKGNFTACALLTHEDPKEAAQFKKDYGLECSDT